MIKEERSSRPALVSDNRAACRSHTSVADIIFGFPKVGRDIRPHAIVGSENRS
jgi:hypothetical protein